MWQDVYEGVIGCLINVCAALRTTLSGRAQSDTNLRGKECGSSASHKVTAMNCVVAEESVKVMEIFYWQQSRKPEADNVEATSLPDAA